MKRAAAKGAAVQIDPLDPEYFDFSDLCGDAAPLIEKCTRRVALLDARIAAAQEERNRVVSLGDALLENTGPV